MELLFNCMIQFRQIYVGKILTQIVTYWDSVCAVYYFFGETAWFVTCITLSVFSIAIHKWFIAKIAAIFEKNKYKRMEKFMES